MNALIAAVNLSDRYITDRFLPDKAIDLIRWSSASRVRLKQRLIHKRTFYKIRIKYIEEVKEKTDAIQMRDFGKSCWLKI